MNTRRLFRFHMLAIACLAVACDATDPKPIASDHTYMPLMKGVYQIYEVDSVWYTATGEYEMQYELMTTVVDSFPDAEAGYTYVIYRYKRNAPENEWQYMDTWSAKTTNLRTMVNEGSTSFVKFVLPVSEGRAWDGNAYNSFGPDEYELISAGKPFTLDGVSYEDCIEVNQNDDDDAIVRTDIRREVYARHTGLILKEVRILNYCTAGCVEFGEIESGVVYSQKLKSYGIN